MGHAGSHPIRVAYCPSTPCARSSAARSLRPSTPAPPGVLWGFLRRPSPSRHQRASDDAAPSSRPRRGSLTPSRRWQDLGMGWPISAATRTAWPALTIASSRCRTARGAVPSATDATATACRPGRWRRMRASAAFSCMSSPRACSAGALAVSWPTGARRGPCARAANCSPNHPIRPPVRARVSPSGCGSGRARTSPAVRSAARARGCGSPCHRCRLASPPCRHWETRHESGPSFPGLHREALHLVLARDTGRLGAPAPERPLDVADRPTRSFPGPRRWRLPDPPHASRRPPSVDGGC